MATNYGTYTLLDTLATFDKTNAFDYGLDDLYGHFRDLLEVHNRIVDDMFPMFVSRTTDKIRRVGTGTGDGSMVEVGEDGLADVQKTPFGGYDVGFPLRLYQYGAQWTERFLRKASVADLTRKVVAAQTADIKRIRKGVLDALMGATNFTFTDYLDNRQDLPVKRLINADSTIIPMDPFGATFNGATHTHYLATASLTAANIVALILTLTEHDVKGGRVDLFINKASEAAVRAFTSNFDGLQAPLLDPGGGSTADVVRGPRDTPYMIDNRLIGVWDGFVWVWVKPWVPANYLIAVVNGGDQDPVLLMREDTEGSFRGLRTFSDARHPLFIQHWEREFGVGVWNRFSAAVLYTASGTYAVPTITA
jgi:hypothetical protein